MASEMGKVARVAFWVCLGLSASLLAAGFILPPTGVIDPSVLTAVGELFAFAALGHLPQLLRGRQVELHHGNTDIVVKREADKRLGSVKSAVSVGGDNEEEDDEKD